MIQAPICDQFPNGGTTQEIADALTNLAYSQKNASAGAFARHMLLNIRDRIAPEYLTDKAEKAVAGTSAQDVIAHIESQATSSEAKEVFDNLLIRRQNVTDGTAQDICDALKAIGDEYDRGGDDFLAEEADLLREQAQKFIKNSTRAAQVQELAQNWKEQEQTWQKPLAAQLQSPLKPAPKLAPEKKPAGAGSAPPGKRGL